MHNTNDLFLIAIRYDMVCRGSINLGGAERDKGTDAVLQRTDPTFLWARSMEPPSGMGDE